MSRSTPSAGTPSARTARLIELLARIQNQTRAAWRDKASGMHPELTGMSYRLLTVIHRFGPLTPAELARRGDVDRSLVSRQVALLRKLGFVTVAPDPEDGRGRILAVSPHAAEVMNRQLDAQRSAQFRALEAWPSADIDLLIALLERLSASFDD